MTDDHSKPRPYPVWVREAIEEFALRADFPSRGPLPGAALSAHPPQSAPKVGRHPMRDYATVQIQPGFLDMHWRRTLQSLVAPELAIAPWKENWLVLIGCSVSGDSLAFPWKPVPLVDFRRRLEEESGQLNIITLPSPMGFSTKATGKRRQLDVLWWPEVDPQPKKRVSREVKAYEIRLKQGRRSAKKAAPASIRVKATLSGAPFPVMREVAVSPNATLNALAEALRSAFGWDGSHSWAFGAGRTYFDEEACARMTVGSLHERRLRGLFWLYDFGDSWHHDLVFRGSDDRVTSDTFDVVASEGPMMEDDIGGVGALASHFGPKASKR